MSQTHDGQQALLRKDNRPDPQRVTSTAGEAQPTMSISLTHNGQQALLGKSNMLNQATGLFVDRRLT
jgi:hypothetical protein